MLNLCSSRGIKTQTKHKRGGKEADVGLANFFFFNPLRMDVPLVTAEVTVCRLPRCLLKVCAAFEASQSVTGPL